MIRYNSSNIVVGEIKQILRSFNLPKAYVLKGDETSYIPNKIYIKDHFVYQSSLGVDADGNTVPVTLTKLPDISYEWGDKLLNITQTLEINTNVYDTYTHKYLGDYLRFLRDYKGLNLMSMYNCFTDESPNTFYATVTRGEVDNERTYVFDASDNTHRLYMIPIRFGQVYTIALNTSRPIEMVAGFYANNEILGDGILADSFRFKADCGSSQVFLYDGMKDYMKYFSGTNRQLLDKESCLYLFLNVSSSYDASIVILEGDYTKSANVFINENGYTEVEYIPSIYQSEGIEINPTPARLQLLACRGIYSYPFADKLIQYLTSNVVTKLDTIPNNIKKAQSTLFDRGYLSRIKKYGVWTADESAACLLCSHKNIGHRELYKDYDNIGYLDSDIESELGGLD